MTAGVSCCQHAHTQEHNHTHTQEHTQVDLLFLLCAAAGKPSPFCSQSPSQTDLLLRLAAAADTRLEGKS